MCASLVEGEHVLPSPAVIAHLICPLLMAAYCASMISQIVSRGAAAEALASTVAQPTPAGTLLRNRIKIPVDQRLGDVNVRADELGRRCS